MNPNTHFLSYRLQNQADSDKKFALIVLNIFAMQYYTCFQPHINNASTLPCENSNAGIAKLKKFYVLTLILLIEKDVTFWLLDHVVANLIRKTRTNIYQNLPVL